MNRDWLNLRPAPPHPHLELMPKRQEQKGLWWAFLVDFKFLDSWAMTMERTWIRRKYTWSIFWSETMMPMKGLLGVGEVNLLQRLSETYLNSRGKGCANMTVNVPLMKPWLTRRTPFKKMLRKEEPKQSRTKRCSLFVLHVPTEAVTWRIWVKIATFFPKNFLTPPFKVKIHKFCNAISP